MTRPARPLAVATAPIGLALAVGLVWGCLLFAVTGAEATVNLWLDLASLAALALLARGIGQLCPFGPGLWVLEGAVWHGLAVQVVTLHSLWAGTPTGDAVSATM